MATIDRLDIEISGSADKAEKALDRLVNKLDTLSQSLGKINGNSINNFSNAMKTLSGAMSQFKDTKVTASTFNGIAEGINKFAKIDTSKITQVGTSLSSLTANLQSISGLSVSTEGLSSLFATLNKMGGKTATQATQNLLIIGEYLKTFIADMNGVQNVTFDVSSLSNLIQGLSKLGYKTATQATANLKSLSTHLKTFIMDLNSIGALNFDMTNLTSLVSAISKLGGVASGRAVANIPALAQALKDLFTTLSTAPNVSQNIIDMTNALANLANTGASAGKAANTLNNSLNLYGSSTNSATQKTKGIVSAIGLFYAKCFLLIRGIKALGNSIKSTSDYIEAFNYFSVAFNKIGSDWSYQFSKYGYDNAESYAKSFSERMTKEMSKLSGITFDADNMRLANNEMKNLGLNIQEVTQYAAELAGVLNSANLTGEATYAASNALIKLAGDYASLINIDYETAAQNFRSGLTGQSEVLYKYGIDVTDARLKTEAYALGISKSVSEMTQSEKMQLRIISVLKQSKIAWGDLANTINQPANQMRVLKTQVQELSMLFGQLFVPILSKVIPVITGVVIALKRLMSTIAEFMGIKLGKSKDYTPDFSNMSSGADDLSQRLDDVTKAAKKAKSGLREFDELKVINMPDTSSANLSGIGDVGALDLTDEILAATSEYEKVWQKAFDNMQSIAEQWADKISVIFRPLQDMFKNISLGNYEEAGTNFSDFWVNVIDGIRKKIEEIDWGEIGTHIGEFLRGFDEKDVWDALVKLKNTIVNALKDLWVNCFKEAPFETALITALSLVKLTGAKDMLKNIGLNIVRKISEHIAMSKLVDSALERNLTTVTTGKGATTLLGKFEIFGSTLGGKIAIGIGSFLAGWNIGKELNNALVDAGILEYKNDKSLLGYLAEIKSGFEDGSWKGALQLWGKDIADGFHFIGDELALTVTDGKQNWDDLMDSFFGGAENLKNNWADSWANIKDNAVIGWESLKQSFFDGWENTKSRWNDGLENLKNNWNESWANIKQKSDDSWVNIKQSFFSGWENIKNWWENSTLSKWWNEDVKPWFTKEKWFSIMGGIKDGFVAGWQNAINAIKSIWNKFANWLNDKLSFEIPSFTNPFTGSTYGGSKIQLGKIPTYATGGFPKTADLFYANENGIPELVGTMGGKTAVASGTEITGISDAVYSTGQTQAGLLQTAVGLLEIIAEKEFGISSDVVFKSVQKSARTYSQRTGKLAFG